MAERVRHVIQGGLVHGKYYKIYVTQVNKAGLESERSDPAIIRVGDVTPPPVPVLSLDTRLYQNGCVAEESKINIMVKWTDVSKQCDDLDEYILYTWNSKPATWTKNGTYSNSIKDTAVITKILPGSVTSETLRGFPNGGYVYVGIVAKDRSRNESDMYILRILAEDKRTLSKPVSPCKAEPYGIWAIRVYTECPVLSNVQYVVFYRDGVKALTPVPFKAGAVVEYVDHLDVMDGLTHFYTYRYVTFDGRESPMSDPSNRVTAKAIDLTEIDNAAIQALKDAWQLDFLNGLEDAQKAFEKRMAEQAKTNQELASRLDGVTQNYYEVYNKYTVLANDLELLSAHVDTTDSNIVTMGSSLRQDARTIALEVSRQETDAMSKTITAATAAKIQVEADRITQAVQDIKGNTSKITQLSNGITQTVTQLNQKIDGVENDANTKIQRMGSSLEQYADSISLKVAKQEVNALDKKVTDATTAMVKVQADRITQVVADTNNNSSQITQLKNAIQQKVTAKDVSAQISLAVQSGFSTAYIEADRITLKGQMLLDGNARIVGKVYSKEFGLVNSETNEVFWGSGSGTIKPTVTNKSVAGGGNVRFGVKSHFVQTRAAFSDTEGYYPAEGYTVFDPTKIITLNYTANPPVNFNGNSRVNATFNIKFGLGWYHNYHAMYTHWRADTIAPNFKVIYAGMSCSVEGYDYVDSPNHPLVLSKNAVGEHHNSPRLVVTFSDGNTAQIESYVTCECSGTWTGILPIGRNVQFYLWIQGIIDDTLNTFAGYETCWYNDYSVKWEAY